MAGGLPVNFESEEVTPSFAEYAAILREAAPALFTGEFRMITEFGRSVMAKNGFIIARVEYTKVTGGRHIAMTHAGAQVAHEISGLLFCAACQCHEYAGAEFMLFVAELQCAVAWGAVL